MEPDLIFIVTYECPGCRVALEDRSSGSPTWQRCPKCGRPSVPPDHQRFHRNPPVKATVAAVDDSILVIGPNTGNLPIRPRSMAPRPPAYGPKSSHFRIIVGSGFFASLILGVFALLEGNTTVGGLFGFVTLACLILLFLPASRTPSE